MKNLWKLYKECVAEAHSIGLDISSHIESVTVNPRLSRALGRCRITGNRYAIEVQPCMLADGIEDRVAKNTIMHEIIHTCPDCFNHGPNFQNRARLVNRKLGYDIHTRTETSKLEAAGVQLKKKKAKYALICNGCGARIERQRWSAVLENPARYRCGSCHGTLRVISLDGNVSICKPIWG